jgi:hypothetical protein
VRRRPLVASSIALSLALAAVAAGCGNERQDAPRVPQAASPSGKRTERLARYGLVFTRPRNWSLFEGRPPQLASVSSGRAIVTLWRYRRVERLPRSDADLVRARKALVAAARRRDKTLRIVSARGLRLDGVPAVEIVADERIGLVRRKVRSTHLYAHGAELVVDAYAPTGEFARVDSAAFVPLLRSLRLTEPLPRRRS